jgi:ribosomal protein S18 acetylase RimI-like enzyme
MNKKDFKISKIQDRERLKISEFINDNWGSSFVVTKGRVYKPENLSGFIIKDNNNKIIGLITYNIENKNCEIITLDSKIENIGLGTELVNKVIEVARANNCSRIWLITTNDNLKAIRYYQKRGFEWIEFHKNAVIESRRIKPEIPKLGFDEIPIKHEIEFEYLINLDKII